MASKCFQAIKSQPRIVSSLLGQGATQQQWPRWHSDEGISHLKLLVNELPLNDDKDRKKPLRIYTRTGDKGTSSLFTGERRPKNDAVFEALGTIDELSCAIGLAREFLLDCDESGELCTQLQEIQCLLQDIQSIVATPLASGTARNLDIVLSNWSGEYLDILEDWIDEHQEKLPELKNFILPVSIAIVTGYPYSINTFIALIIFNHFQIVWRSWRSIFTTCSSSVSSC